MRMIVAVDADNAIGWSDGRLPWKSTLDMKRFKELTSAPRLNGGRATVVMGRKTFDSIGKPLPNRVNFVLTRDQHAYRRIDETGAQALSQSLESYSFDKETWLIGGATLYDEALEKGLISKLYITCVHLPGSELGRLTGSSGADVRLKHDLYNWVNFTKAEQEVGRIWLVREINSPTVILPDPGVTFITLERIA